MRGASAAGPLLATLLALAASAPRTVFAQTVPETVELSWLAGDWRRCRDDEVVEERWLGPCGGLLVGVNLTSRANGRATFENMRIGLDPADGAWTFWASPMGRAPAVPFRLVDGGERRAVFANPQHRFPARVVYWRDGDDLLARIEGTGADGRALAVEWRFAPGTAADCPTPR